MLIYCFTVAQQKNANTVPKRSETKTEEEEDPISYDRIKNAIENEVTFDNQLTALLNAVQLTEFELTTRYNVICNHLDEIFRSVFPECRTYRFGSTVAQLSFKESDLDIYMYVGRMGKKFSNFTILCEILSHVSVMSLFYLRITADLSQTGYSITYMDTNDF